MSYLIWFRSHNRYDSCKITEIEYLAESFGQRRETVWESQKENASMGIEETKCRVKELNKRSKLYSGDIFVKGYFKNEEICKNIIMKSILAKGIIDIWSEGNTYDDVLKELLNKKELFEKYIKDRKWAFRFASFRKVIKQEERVKKMNYFQQILNKYNKVDILNPDVQLALFEEYDKDDTNILKKVYFGRCIALRSDFASFSESLRNGPHYNKDGHETEKKDINYTRKAWWHDFTLSRRPVLAPTTTDNELAFIMCNIGKVGKGKIVLDPFVGSGGLLIACAVFNAVCIGSDIDIRLLKGHKLSYLNKQMKHKNTEKHIYQNFLHYNLNIPDIVRSDASNPVWNFLRHPWVDAIITDPPYGNRAGVRTSLKKKLMNNVSSSENNNCVVNFNTVKNKKCNSVNRKTEGYDCDEAVRDLLTIASNVLVDNGMLVFLYPIQLGIVRENLSILKHPDFYLNTYDLQTMTSTTGRLIVSMQRKERK